MIHHFKISASKYIMPFFQIFDLSSLSLALSLPHAHVRTQSSLTMADYDFPYLYRIPSLSFFGWRYWLWNGNSSDFKDQGGVPRSHDVDIFCISFSQGFRHSCRTIQCHFVCSSACREC